MICCLTFNRQPFTKLCLENLFNGTNEPFDLFLWDNGSEKPTLDLLDKLEGLKFKNGTTITIIRNKVNFGISDSQAALQKFRKAGQHFIKLDNDVIVPKDPMWLTTLCEILDHNTVGFQVVGYPQHSPQFFYTYKDFVRMDIKLPPLTADGREFVEVYKTPLMIGQFLLSSKFMDRFTFPSSVKSYGEGDDIAVGDFAGKNKIPMAFIRPPSMPDWMENNAYLLAKCPEYKEYQAWKVSCLTWKNRAEVADFKPTMVGNDLSELMIRKDLII